VRHVASRKRAARISPKNERALVGCDG